MGLTFVLLIMAIIYLPVLLLVFLSFSDGLQYYVELFTNAHYMQAVGNTLLIAFVSSLIATIIATMAATGIIYLGKRSKALTMTLNQLPIVNADIVTSFSLVLLFVGLGLTNFGLLKLILAHVLIALPFCLLTVLPKLRQLDTNLIDAALDLGATPWRAFTSVIVPQLVPAMVQAFLLGFTLSLDDFVITQYNNSGVPTIATVVYGAISRRDIPNAFKALTTIIFAVILIVLVIMNVRVGRQRRGLKLGKRTVAIITAVVVLVAGCGIIPLIVNNLTPRSSVLKIYNWEDYIAIPDDGEGRDLVAEFEAEYRKQTGDKNFRVEYHTFTDNEELYSKIKTQKADYDLIFPSEYLVEKMAAENLLQTIKLDQLDADIVAGLDQDILARTTDYTAVTVNGTVDTNQVWGIPYMVGTVGIMYDTTVIEQMAGTTGIDPDTFETMLQEIGFGVLFGAKYTDATTGTTYDSSKFKSHITMKKSARDSVGIAMLYAEQERIKQAIAAHDPDTVFDNTELSNILNMQGEFTLAQARQVLTDQIRTMNPFYENDNGKKAFADPHDTRFAYGLFWSCDAGLTMGENVDDNKQQLENLKFYAPTGTNLWTDNFAIPTYARNTDAAYAFMNFMLDAENAAANIDYVGSQMAVADQDADGNNTAVGDLKDEYGFDPDADNFTFDNSYVNAVFPPDYALTYSAIMHNFTPSQETAVNDLMVSIQNQAAELTESASSGTHVFRWLFLILIIGGVSTAFGYYCTHRRPHASKPTATPPTADQKHRA